MNFSELEQLMSSRGVTTLAEIARTLNTTPQAVSNWKARDQVPYHIIAKIKNYNNVKSNYEENKKSFPKIMDKQYSVTDFLLILAQNIKILFLSSFLTVFFTFTYIQFILIPEYVSTTTLLIPESQTGKMEGLSGLASQFGVNLGMPAEVGSDLSNPRLIPELIGSRTFVEKIVDKMFYSEKYKKELSLLAILTHGDDPPNQSRDIMIDDAKDNLAGMISFSQGMVGTFSVLRVRANEPVFAKELADVVLYELENLHRLFKSQVVKQKINFIENRLTNVNKDLELSERSLKTFNEENRQISSPSLQLEQDRLERDVEVQKNIFLTLKQQLELSKIEEIQKSSIIQVLDRPQVPQNSSNKKLRKNLTLGLILGLALGILLSLIRNYLNSSDIDERKKIRQTKNFFIKKSKDTIFDSRFSGIISLAMILCLPYYIGHRSISPVFFGMYSLKFMILNSLYVLTLLIFTCIYFLSKRK